MVETLREKQEVGGTRGPNTEDEPVQRIMGNFYKVHRAVFGDPHFDQQALYTNRKCAQVTGCGLTCLWPRPSWSSSCAPPHAPPSSS